MKITVRERQGKSIDEMIGPNDNLVFRCLRCQEFLLPREYHVMNKRWWASDGYVRSVAFELCPVCFPNPHELEVEEMIDPSAYVILTKEEFFRYRRYEKAGIIPPEGATLLQNVH